MRFERVPDDVEAEFFHTADIDRVTDFLSRMGIDAQVRKVRLPGPGRGISDGLEIRTIFQNKVRTITGVLPVWVAVTETRWVNLYPPDKFERSFRKK